MRVELYGCPQECKAALGMENGKILDGQISASSEHSSSLAAIHGRLHYQGPQGNDGAWAASTNDFHQWLQIDLGSQFFKVKGVATQSRQNVMQYVTKYKLQYSNNGLNFKFYREEGSYENKLFIGNSDKNNVVSHDLNPPIRARFIRFRPREWFKHISMRVELYGCQVCRDGLGMESGAITDGQISASSEWDANHSAAQGRLHLQPSNNLQGCWSAALNDGNQWLKVDLGTVYTAVTRVATQGRNGTSYRQWVTKYKLQYSDNGENFKYYTEEGQNTHKVFTGNTDHDTVVSRDLYPPIRVRYIRFRPVSWEGHISMRVELYGCQECQESLGVETKKIPDDQLTASSKLNDNLAPKFGRLYLEEKLPHQEGSWAALHNDTNQWLQVDVGSYYVKVTRVATQGRNGSDQWVTQYRLQYGDDVANLQRYKEYNQDIEKVFDGNTDADTVVSHDLVPPIRARYVRFLPGGWHIHISMRVDLYGCEECQEALGMENGVILDEKITVSSQYAERTGPARARLYIENTFGTGGWVPTLQDANPWLQIDLVSQYRVTHVATQGRYHDELSIWVIKYKLIYRSEGEYFKYYKEEGQTTEKVKIFMAIF
nr:lactadherin-like [Pocillopora verrucosa]